MTPWAAADCLDKRCEQNLLTEVLPSLQAEQSVEWCHHMSPGFDLMGRHEEAVEQFASARLLFGRSIGADSIFAAEVAFRRGAQLF